MNSVESISREIVQEFEQFETVDEKYVHLFGLGETLPTMPPAMKNETTKVQGCQSDLWFRLSRDENGFHLQADSDSLIIKAIAALLKRVIENSDPADLQSLSLDFIDELNIWKLASERNNGLIAMLDHLKEQIAMQLAEGGGSHG